jgi:hypothetical protein
MQDPDAYLTHPSLKHTDLPLLVKRERTIAAKLAPLAELEELGKETRKRIHELLLQAGFQPKDWTTVNGYQVRRESRAGQTSFNDATCQAQLVAGGVDADLAASSIAASFEQAPTVYYASVKPMRGALVRKRREAKTLLRASLKPAA